MSLQNFKKIYIKIVFIKDNIHIFFFKIKSQFLLFLKKKLKKKKYVNVVFHKDDFHLKILLKTIFSKNDFQLSLGDKTRPHQYKWKNNKTR